MLCHGQLRAHADVSGWLKKPIIVSAFSKQRRTEQSDMATRNAFYEMVYQEAERSDAIAGGLTAPAGCKARYMHFLHILAPSLTVTTPACTPAFTACPV